MVTGSYIRYNVFLVRELKYFKTNCELKGIIPSEVTLSDSQVKEYFGIDETSRYWGHCHKSSRFQRLVFDKCIVPCVPNLYRIEVMQ